MSELAKKLQNDCAVGPSLRARLWSHEGSRRLPCRPVGHAGLELAWVEEGSVEYRIGQRSIELSAGQAVLVPSNVEHATIFEAPMRAGALWLSDELVGEMTSILGQRGARAEPGLVLESGAVVELGRALARQVREHGSGHLRATEAIAEAMTITALRGAPSRRLHDRARDPRVMLALERIHDTFHEPITVDELARAASTTRFHFTRIFSDEIGEPPHRYLTRVRLARAAELLRSGRASVTEVAFSVGFPDLGRFARAFRGEYGVNPAAFARAARPSNIVSSQHDPPSD